VVTPLEGKPLLFHLYSLPLDTTFRMYSTIPLLVINSNRHFISYRFGVIAAYCSNFWTLSVLRPPLLHPLGSIGTNYITYDVHIGLIGKRVVDFLLLLIEHFSLGVTAEVLLAKTDRKSAIISLQRSHFNPKFQVEGVAPTNHFCTVS